MDFRNAGRRPIGDAWFDATVSPLRDATGEIAGVLATVFETTERKRADAALRDSEQRFRAFVTASADVVYRMSPDWSEMRQLEGRNFLIDTDTPNADWLDLYIHPDDQASVRTAIDLAIRAKSTFEFEHRVIRADGSLGHTNSRAVPILNDQGEVREWLGTATNATDKQRGQIALRESEERFTQFAKGLVGRPLDSRRGHACHGVCQPGHRDDLWHRARRRSSATSRNGAQ